MSIARRQRTVSRLAVVEGFGYFSGRDVRVEFRPAAVNAGVTFVRCDLSSPVVVPASASLRLDIPLRTTLERNGVRVEMVEHILAALAGLHVDNCEIWVDAPEMPGCDGSSLAFVEAIDAAGITEQDAPARQLVVDRPIRVVEDDSWIEAQPPLRAGTGLCVSFELDYGPRTAIGRQSYAIDVTPKSFRTELAPCRTFLLEHVARAMKDQGIGKRVKPQDLLIFGPDGPIDNALRFPDECVRHKVLDVLGDLALTGREIVGHIVACRSGHRLHAELAKRLTERAATRRVLAGPSAARRCA
jgi:UDP-3-O-acyl N-acetylglucosamine deacetylase